VTERFGVRTGKSRVLKWSAAGVIVLCAIMGAFYVDTHGQEIRHQLTLATTRQPEQFTELYLLDTNTLPATVTPGQTVPLHFAIKNLEQKPMDYQYVITFTDAAGYTELHTANVHLANSQSQMITQNVVVPKGEGRGKLVVQLTHKNQSVHYWLERS
jgi:hypothetical protein